MKEAKAKTSDMMWVKVFGTGSSAPSSRTGRPSRASSGSSPRGDRWRGRG